MSKSELHAIIERGHELAPSTRERYLRDIDDFIEFAGTDPANWTAKIAEDYYDALLKRMEPQSANRMMASLLYAAKWRAQQQQVPNFAIIRRASNNPREISGALDESAAQRLVRVCIGDRTNPLNLRDTALVVVELETGMRRMSLQSMQWELIERESKHGYPVAHVLAKGYGKHRQDVPLSDTAIKALEAWRLWCANHGRAKGPVFHSLTRKWVNGSPIHKAGKAALSATAIQEIMTKRATEAGIDHIHPHMFRHTFVTWRMNAGIPPHEISVITGHKLPGLGAASGFQQAQPLGTLGGYFDARSVGEKVRNSTPQWLKELFP